MTLETLALIIMIIVAIILFYAIIAIHDIPYNIAKKRNHPHAEAIHYGGWVSMFTLHAIWPFLWIWATLYHAYRGYGFSDGGAAAAAMTGKLEALETRMDRLEQSAAPEDAEG
ncbi:DUF3302 domain-containing protein [Sneathiella marina]|uniref:DUF3302 domain-containing protein n=1 Tax=Sneathiella marina TaxID=2950108 RepID=UPI00308453BC